MCLLPIIVSPGALLQHEIHSKWKRLSLFNQHFNPSVTIWVVLDLLDHKTFAVNFTFKLLKNNTAWREASAKNKKCINKVFFSIQWTLNSHTVLFPFEFFVLRQMSFCSAWDSGLKQVSKYTKRSHLELFKSRSVYGLAIHQPGLQLPPKSEGSPLSTSSLVSGLSMLIRCSASRTYTHHINHQFWNISTL